MDALYDYLMTIDYTDLDQLHNFLKRIRSIDEFFEQKKPGFRDWYSREMAHRMVDEGHISAEAILLGLKQEEKRLFIDEAKASSKEVEAKS